MAYCPPFEAIVLVGGDQSSLFPLTSPTRPLCLLPVGNKPLISYPLKLLTDSGVKKIFLVSQGEYATQNLKIWINDQFQLENKINIEIVEVAEDAGNVDCVRTVMNKITQDRVIILTGDLVCDLSLNSVIAKHFLSEFDAMVVFSHRRTSASSETKLGKAPKNVDYTVMDSTKNNLLFYVDSPEASREIQLPTAAILKYGPLNITTNYVDTHAYVFSKKTLQNLCNINSFTNIQSEWLPCLINKDLENLQNAEHDADGAPGGPQSENKLLNKCGVYLIPEKKFCVRATTATNYAEINREVITPELVQKFLNISPSKYDNIVPSSVILGNKSMVGSSCMVGADTEIGDKSGVKKSVIGRKCKIGANVKIVNSVLMDGVVVGEGCHLQHSVLCEGVKVGDRCSLKDCQIGEGYQVVEGMELKGEVLAQAKQ